MKRTMKDYLDTLEHAKGRKRDALERYNMERDACAKAFVPLGGDANEVTLKRIYDMCNVPSTQFSRSDLFVCASLLWFNPDALYDGKVRLSLAKKIAKVLGVTYSNVYITRKKVSLWMTLYPDFYASIGRIFTKLTTL